MRAPDDPSDRGGDADEPVAGERLRAVRPGEEGKVSNHPKPRPRLVDLMRVTQWVDRAERLASISRLARDAGRPLRARDVREELGTEVDVDRVAEEFGMEVDR